MTRSMTSSEKILAGLGIHLLKEKHKDDDDGVLLSIVLVPAAASLPLQELVFTTSSPADAKGDSLLLDLLEPYFVLQPGETVDMSLIEKQANAEREAGCATGMCPHVSPTTLQRAAEVGTLETIKIRNGGGGDDDDGNTGSICMYLDESAMFKQRPLNQRAMEYAKNKYDDESIHGDVFLARMRQNELVSLRIEAMKKEEWFVEEQ